MDPSTAGEALAARLAELEAALERYEAFAFEPGRGPVPPAPRERAEAARELLLRALREAGDPVNFRILRRLAEGQTPLAELVGLVSLPRISVWERVNDLVQVGLAARSLEGDSAGATAMGLGLVRLVEESAAAAGGGGEA